MVVSQIKVSLLFQVQEFGKGSYIYFILNFLHQLFSCYFFPIAQFSQMLGIKPRQTRHDKAR